MVALLVIFKKITVIFLLCSVLHFSVFAVDYPDISASGAVLIDSDTEQVLYEKNAHAKMSMASTTKIMTVLIAVESGKMDDVVTVDEKIYIEGTAIGFEKNDKITVEDLCYAALLESGNDAAVLIAEHFAGSEEAFSKIMNTKAEEIGMTDTNFVTASGLDDKEHYTTAYDMAVLGVYAVKNDEFKKICSTKTYTSHFVDSDKVRYFSNHNKLLRYVDGVFGIKTGFTKKSGRCLISACERDGKTLVVSTLKAPDDWNDHDALYEYGYSLFEKQNLVYNKPITNICVIGSDKKIIATETHGAKEISVLKNSKIKTEIHLKRFFYAPIKKHDILGEIKFFQNKKLIATHQITAAEDADVIEELKYNNKNIFKKLFSYISRKG